MPRKRKASVARAKGLRVTQEAALSAKRLDLLRKFATRSRRFMDAYERGLNGKQAAWAARRYRGHRMLPESILDELEKEGI